MKTNKNFVNFHILISHSPSCLNRDDMNMQKTAIFGGKTRVRISSQSLKRAMRKSPYYQTHFGEASIRTRELEKLISQFTEQLRNEFDPNLIAKTMELFVKSSQDQSQADGDDAQSDDSTEKENKKLAVAPWALQEIRVLCNILKDIELTDEEIKKAREKAAKQKGKNKKTEKELIDEALGDKRLKAARANAAQIRQAIHSALDIALSGRMATSGLMTSIDGALAVAHVLTTHAVEPQDVDWFTAVDDLVVDSGEVGAGHLDTQQFSAGVFYRYASLNLKQLQVNLGLIPDMTSTETPESRQRALEIARHVCHLLSTVVPSAKQQSFAAHNLADFVLVSFSDIPISLVNAFEKPIKQPREGGYLEPSIQALASYWGKLNTFYNLDENAVVACASASLNNPTGLQPLKTLPAVEAWIAKDGQN